MISLGAPFAYWECVEIRKSRRRLNQWLDAANGKVVGIVTLLREGSRFTNSSPLLARTAMRTKQFWC